MRIIDPDPLDVLVIAEGRLGFMVPCELAHQVISKRPTCDATVGELFELLSSEALKCRQCEYDLRGHSQQQNGNCPECGKAFDMAAISPPAIWQVVCEAIASIIEKPAGDIKAHQFIYADLDLANQCGPKSWWQRLLGV